MLITKIFKVESSHRVVNCSSERCKFSLHGHSAVIEVTLNCTEQDNGGMGYDFGLMKGTIKEYIDSMDHCNISYANDDKEYVDFIKKFNQRWIELPVTPSAEFLSAYLFAAIQNILTHTNFANGEGTVEVYSVKYHETSTGSATCFKNDMPYWFPYYLLDKIQYSDGVLKDWSEDLKNIVFKHGMVSNKPAVQQVQRSW